MTGLGPGHWVMGGHCVKAIEVQGKHFDNMHCRKYADSESRDDPL